MEKAMFSRRSFLGTATALASATAISGRVQAANIPEAPIMDKATMQPPLHPTSGPVYNPVVTLNGWRLPWRLNGDWEEFHLVAEPVEREFADGMKAFLWGYNGQSPGPTIEAVEGDKVRIFVTNKLPEHTTVHWHGMLLPNGMDAVEMEAAALCAFARAADVKALCVAHVTNIMGRSGQDFEK